MWVRYRRSGPASRTGGRTDCNRSRRSAWLCPRWLEIRDRNALENRRAQEVHWQILGGRAYAKLALRQMRLIGLAKDPLTPTLSPRGEGVWPQPLRRRCLSPWGEGRGEGGLLLTHRSSRVRPYHGKCEHGKRGIVIFFARHFLRIFCRFRSNSTTPKSV